MVHLDLALARCNNLVRFRNAQVKIDLCNTKKRLNNGKERKTDLFRSDANSGLLFCDF